MQSLRRLNVTNCPLLEIDEDELVHLSDECRDRLEDLHVFMAPLPYIHDAPTPRHENVSYFNDEKLDPFDDSDHDRIRPTVGDRVVVTGTDAFRQGASGTIIHDDHDEKPYRVRFDDGHEEFYLEVCVVEFIAP